jgi:hypothetical protein
MRDFKLILSAMVLALVAGMVLPGIVQAQSPFALSNIGQPIDSEDARMMGRGGWGMAVYDSLNPGFLNVASSSALRHVVVKFTAYGEKTKSDDDMGSRTTHRTLIPDIRVGLPIIKGRLAFSTGIEVKRSSEYRTMTPMTWYAMDDTLTGNEQFLREGSLWQVPIGLSLKVFNGLSLGGTLGLVNGTIRESLTDFYLQPSTIGGTPLYLSSGTEQKDEFTGTMTTWSMHLGSPNSLAFGASWTPAHNLDVNRKIALAGVGAKEYSTWIYDLPDTYRAGFQARLSDRWSVGGDATLQTFGDFRGNEEWASDMVDEYTVALGLEREIAFTRHGGKGNMPVRLGARFRRWGYLVNDAEVEETTFSVGTGFPFRSKMGTLDVALSYSMIGDLAKNDRESNVWRMTLSITGLERWW